MSNPIYIIADFIYNFKLENMPKNITSQAILSTYNAICVSIGASRNKQVKDIVKTYFYFDKALHVSNEILNMTNKKTLPSLILK